MTRRRVTIQAMRPRIERRLIRCMMLAACVIALGGCAWIPWPAWLEKPIDTLDDAIQRIDREVDRVARRLDLPGLSFIVFDERGILWRRDSGWADVEDGIPIDEETIFRVGSISKAVTAVEIMRLVDEGQVELDAAITEYLPDFTVQRLFDDAEPLTIRSLLTHRSGLPRNGTLPLWMWDAGAAALRDYVASLAEAYAAYAPWTRYKYSNVGYCVLGRVIERLRGGGFPDIMRRELLAPLGMTSSAFVSTRLASDRTIATGYWPTDDGNVASHAYDIVTMPSGNLYATASDLARFAQVVLRDGTIDGERLLSEAALAEMLDARYAREADPQTNALGWFTDTTFLGEKAVFHDGTNDGTISMLALLPERRIGLVAIANSDAFEDAVVELTFDAFDWLRQGLYRGNRPAAEKEPAIDVPADVLARYEGTYIAEGEPVAVALRGDRLIADALGVSMRLRPLSTARFRAHHPLIPLGEVRFAFSPELGDDLIVTLGGSYHIYAPRYPMQASPPEAWEDLLHDYTVHPRHESRYSDADVLWTTQIAFEDGLLTLDSTKRIVPIDDEHIRIVGGIFDGEIMDRDPTTGVIEWGAFRYVPTDST